MIRIHSSIIVLIIAATSAAFAQPDRRMPGGTITGIVFDQALQIPVEYANIILYNPADSSQVTGTSTDRDGFFRLNNVRPGAYYLEVYFLGYETKRFDNIELNRKNPEISLGEILLEQTALSMESIEVEGERPPVSYQIDKKVINVDQQFSTISGSAVDVLENVPSVTVDIEGNVSLRGSSNFRVLIDGRPSILEASEALQQIPAGTIENIEIITNPSAKYDREGASGIINIILKKNRQTGRSGIANLDAGVEDKYGGDFLLEYKNKDYNAVFNVDYRHRFYTGEEIEENRTTQQGLNSYIYSDGKSRRGRSSWGLRGALDVSLSSRDFVMVGMRYGDRSSQRSSDLDYDEWAEPDNIHVLYTSTTERERDGYFYGVNTSYRHQFKQKEHVLTGDIFYSYRDFDEKTVNELLSDTRVITSGQRSTESGPDKRLRAKLDYSHPFGEENRFEMGFQSQFNQSDAKTELYEYSPADGKYILQPQFSNSTVYNRNIHAVYSIYSAKWNDFGYQLGLRGEYTDRRIEFSGDRFTIDRWDYFPTVYISYQFKDGQQLMASYSRRINRPRGWHLEPFETWMDAYNVRVGNPSLKPEYIDSYEFGYQTYFGKNLFSTEAYYRKTNNKIERVRSVYDENITLHSTENIGQDYAFGTELFFNLDMSKKWNINLMGNLYNYRVEGKLYGDDFSRESFNWGSRAGNTIKIGNSMQVQLDGRYRSATVSSQGRRKGSFTTNAAVKYELIEKQLSATLQVRDLFGTGKYEYSSEGPNFYSYNYSTREAPLVMLNVRYNFNNYKPDRRRDRADGNDEVDEEF